MPGFDNAAKDIVIADSPAQLDLDLKLKSAPAAAAAPALPPQTRRTGPQARGGPAPGFQQMAMAETPTAQVQAALSAPAPEMHSAELNQNANEAFLLNGSLSRGLQDVQREDPFTMNRDQFRERLEMMRAGGGFQPGMPGGGFGPGGPGGPGGPAGEGGPGMRGGGPMMMGGPGGFGGRRPGGPGGRAGGPPPGRMVFGNRTGRARDSIRGGASFSLGNSAFDARPYSISGQEVPKPSYAQTRFGLMAGGSLHIPKIVRDDKTFWFANYFGARSRNPFNSISTMPTELERAGDFSQSFVQGPVTIADPRTGQPFPNNVIPSNLISPAARELLTLFPLPNLANSVQNYQLITSVPSDSDSFGLRLGRAFSRSDRLAGSFQLQQRSSQAPQLYGFIDDSSGRGLSADMTWTHTVRQGFLSNLRASFSRNSNDLIPYFAYGRNWAADLGISGVSTDPLNYGPPNLSFTNFGALTDGSPSIRHDQTVSVSESVVLVHKSHNLTFGGDYRRTQRNSVSQQNARGSYTFSGIASSLFDGGGAVAATGFDFADFLLGLPQSSSIRFGNADTYFRGPSTSLFLQDDWRVRGNLSINAGIRYELAPPLYEKYGRMANLDVAPGFTSVAVVLPGESGPYSGAFPESLIDTDRNNIAPRIGIAWRPFSKRTTQIRAGYGWYYNGSVMNQWASRLAQQPPFATSGQLVTSASNPLTIENGFSQVRPGEVTNSYAVDRGYRIGYAQTWNFAVQEELPHGLIFEVGYLGTKGTRLDMQRWPNRTVAGTTSGAATGFVFDSSEANSIFHAGQVRVMRRFRGGLSANALYTYGKSIDNASTIGGGGAVVAQDDSNLSAERGLSSFDQRHTLNLFSMFTTSAGRRASGGFQPGFRGALLRDWTLTGGLTIRSGSAFTAQVLGNRADQGGAGTIGSGRADATGLPVLSDSGFFNLAAFTVPAARQYGNASRNTIPGPGFFALNMSLGRALHLGERRSIDLRLEANNLLNSVNISRIGTTVNALNYGLALGASSMRTVQINLRMRF